MDKIRNAISRFGGTVLVTLLLAFVVYNAWGVLVTNSRYPGATWMNVANWPDSSVPMPVSLSGGGSSITNNVGVTNGGTFSASVTNAVNIGTQIFNTNQFVRVNNTTAYSANQFMGPSTSATNLPMAIGVTTVPGGSGIIEQIRFNTFNNAWTGINVVFYLSTNITAQADGTAYTFYMTNAWARIGPPVNIPLQAGTDCAFGAVGMDGGLHIKFQCAPGDTNLYYNLIVPSGLTPVAFQTNWIQVQSRAWNY